MSKPKWEDAPEWAMFLAKDEDHCWYWYEKAPEKGFYAWRRTDGRCMYAGGSDFGWDSSLEARP